MPAVVMNMFYTGLGIARSLGEQGIAVLGLSTQRWAYGAFSRYGRTVRCPDSRNEPEALLLYLLDMGRTSDERSVIFPTRDDDVAFLDRFRRELDPYFIPVIPGPDALAISLSKWKTYELAQKAGVPVPKAWMIGNEDELRQAADEIRFPCILKPVVSSDWRRGGNWELVGARKAIGIGSREELLAEYDVVGRADRRALLQEMVPGGDDRLMITACYLNAKSEYVAGFNTQKLLQSPEGFGTGYLVQAAHCPDLLEPTLRLLREIRYTGIAEVEYKWDAKDGQYKLIEINPRPWDQHRLGAGCGADLMHFAYCDLAGLKAPAFKRQPSTQKWVAEDTMIMTALRLLLARDARLWSVLSLARGKRIYAIWSAKDPLPFLVYAALGLIPALVGGVVRKCLSVFTRKGVERFLAREKRLIGAVRKEGHG